MSTPVISSPNDPYLYRYLVLKNKIKLLLVNDQKATQSAASVAINVGHFDDPIDRQGMAHFLEHMLFLGTEKFPTAGEFHDFINNHGGNNNAWTGTEHTNYYFQINSQYFEQALNRFSQFFISPLFEQQFIDKERHAIDSEFRLKLNDEQRRILQVYKETVSPLHPFSKFSVGNLETLTGDAKILKQELQTFYDSHYSANLMTLTLAGSFSLDYLEQLARQYFEPIANKNIDKQYANTPLYNEQQCKLQINIKPLKKQHKLTLCFALPSYKHLYHYKPLSFISYLLGDEGIGSALSCLKKQGLATQISAGGGISGYNFKDYCIALQLTDNGVKHLDYVIKVIFEYIQLIKEQGLKSWRYQERRHLLKLAFLYQQSIALIDLVSYLSVNMHHYAPQDIIYGDYSAESFIIAQYHEILALFTPDNLRLQLISPTVTTDQIANWYHTHYSVFAITQTRLNSWKQTQTHPSLSLPTANIFIPNDKHHDALTLADSNREQIPAIPQVLTEALGYKFWYVQEHEFKVPKGHIYLSLDCSTACGNIRQASLTRLYVELLLDYLTEYTYPAEVADLHYSIYAHQAGISLHISGYTQNQEKLLLLIIEKARERNFSEARFAIIKEHLLKKWQNSAQAKPISQLFSGLTSILQLSSYSSMEMAQTLQSLTLVDLFDHLNRFYSKNHLEGLFYGNWNKPQVKQFITQLTQMLTLVSSPSQETKRELISINNKGTLVREFEVNHSDNAIIVYYQSDNAELKNMALFSLLNHTMSSAFFYKLRTQQQLGYMVGTGYLPVQRHPGIIFYIQSPTHDPLSLLKAIDEFIADFNYAILQLSAHDWDASKKGLIQQLNEPDVNMQNRSQRYWSSIGNKNVQFNQRSKIAKKIQLITKAELMTFINTNLTSKYADRLVLITKKLGVKQSLPFSNVITDLAEFKATSARFILVPDR